jgi:phosphatidate cytidylyltransferase
LLLTRLVTALVLLPIVLAALFFAPRAGWMAFCLLLMGVAAWEWSRLAQLSERMQAIYTAALVGAMVAICALSWRGDIGALAPGAALTALVFWCFVAPWWLCTQRRATALVNALVGAVVLLPMLIALLVLREQSPWLLLSFALIVWVADVAAYFAGKNFGRHKLAPAISPGKTIEGAIGGLVGVVAFFFLWHWLANDALRGSWAYRLLGAGGWTLGLFLLLAVSSIVGDLFESWLKRGAGLKDSSNLLPGHGGVLDRIDALTPTLPLAMAWTLFGARPGA